MSDPGPADPVLTFAYHKSLSPMLGLLLGIAIVETMVVHLIAMALWGWRVALVLMALDLSLIVALVRLLRSFRRLPVMLFDGRLTMRAGSLKRMIVEVDNIAGLREHWDAASINRRGVLNLALIAWPNVVIDLKTPVGLKRRIDAIAHRFDDPEAFRTALAARHPGLVPGSTLRETMRSGAGAAVDAGSSPA